MVEWKKLISVSNVQYGYPFESSYFTEDQNNIPLIRIRDIKPGKASTYYSGSFLEEYRIRKGDILVGMDGEFNLGKWNDRDGLLNQRVLKLKSKEGYSLDGYLFHYMGPLFKKIEKETAGGSVKHLSAKVINNIQIPIPSLSEQQRIVGILDTFTSSIENLKEQIAQRGKQYEYYRDKLLDLEGKDGVEMNKLEDVCDIKGRIGFRGYTRDDQVSKGEGAISLTATNITNQRIDYTNNTYITWEKYYESPEIMVQNGDIIVCQRGSIGKIALVENLEEKATINPQLLLLKKIKINIKYLAHTLWGKYFQYDLSQIVGHGTVQMIAQKDFKKLTIPVPSLSEQQRIVSILDTFEASIRNLEAQLKEREKQYEYYRNKLLTFE